MENPIQALLTSLEICEAGSIKEFYPRVRDRDDVKVLRCDKSEVIFLSRTDHVTDSHYKEKSDFSYWSTSDRKQAVLDCYEDDHRRAVKFGALIHNKTWLDIGTGAGGILDILARESAECCAVEPQAAVRNELIKCGYKVCENLDVVEDEKFDIVTLFHVFEHFCEPLDELKKINKKMVACGKIVIEVPHAKDFLLSFLDLNTFKAFTFWSEHLILHTRQSLDIFLQKAGFRNICITGYQRYPLANHMYWLAKGKPGGHKEWSFMVNPEIDCAYQRMLAKMDATDTLIATAQK